MFDLSSSPRLLPLFGAAMICGSALLPINAAAAGGGFYRAELSQPAPTGKFVARDVVWSCDGTQCVGARGTSRPVVMCASLAKKAGAVTGFIADGKPLGADELARCNGAG